MQRYLRQINLFLLIIFIAWAIKAWTLKANFQHYSEMRMLMGTYVKLDVCYDQEQDGQLNSALKQVWTRLEDIAWRMNVFDERSDVTKVNNSYKKPVAVGEDTYAVLKSALEISKLTEGAFDITVFPLIKLWKESAKAGREPSLKEINDAKFFVGGNLIEFLPSHQIQIKKINTSIDLGGIAAGYAVDEAAKILRKNGFVNFFIDAGGDIYVGGLNCQKRLWRIGIKDPKDKSKIVDVVQLTNAAITTSGDYEKFYLVNGEKWSHIINPVTGFPQKGVVSTSVIAQTTEEADALATAFCVLSPQESLKVANTWPRGTIAILILSPGEDNELIRFSNDAYSQFRVKGSFRN